MSKSMSIESVRKLVEECGRLYNFNGEDALRMLGYDEKVKRVKVEKSKYPMPFDGSKKEGYCNGIVKNHGLYTQCEKKVKEGYCKGCEENEYGNIEERLKVDLYEYKDRKGKSPKRYIEVLKKLKISKESVEEEAKRLNITINPIHFEEVCELVKRGRPKSEKKVKEATGKKGRPKKEKKTVEVSKNVEEEDLFATLIANANAKLEVAHAKLEVANANIELANASLEALSEVEECVEEVLSQPLSKVEEKIEEVLSQPLSKVEEKKPKKVKEVDPAKEAEKQKKAEEKAAKEAAKEAEKQKKAEEKAAKEAEKQKKAEEKAAKKSKDLAPPLSKVDAEEEADVVRKIEFEGKSYYKSKNTGVIYNMEQEVVGKWNSERNEIDFEEEEEEEEYDD